jgi:hypothetical protein
MSPRFPRTFHVLCLLFSALAVLPKATALYETVYVVGPIPEPIVPDDGSEDAMAPPDDLVLPTASIPINATGGNRYLKEQYPPAATAFENEEANRRNLMSSIDDQKITHHYLRSEGAVNPEARSLVTPGTTVTKTILGFNYDDNLYENGKAFIPPDPHGAAGLRRLVGVVNSMVEVRKKDGTLTFLNGFQKFFAGFEEAFDVDFFFDPRVIYDEHEGRFVIVVLQQSDSPPISRIWLAVSTGEEPDSLDDWNQYFFNSALSVGGENSWADFPGLEVDEEAVYVSANMFRFSDRNFAGTRLWIINKEVYGGFYGGGDLSILRINPYLNAGLATTTMPVQVHGSSGVDGSVGTFFISLITDTDDGYAYLQIYTIYDPLGDAPSYTLQTIVLGIVTQNDVLPDAPQPGTKVKINTGQFRVVDAVWRKKKMWLVFTINPTSGVNKGQATAHWVRCSTSGGRVTFEAQGDLGGEGIAVGTYTYFPSVAVSSRGLVAYGYAASSPAKFIGAYVSVGTSEQSYTVKTGMAPYIRYDDNGWNRWGDYTGISVDPADDTFWVFNEYAETIGSADFNGDGRWGTVWGRVAQAPELDCTITWNLYNSKTNTYVAALTNGAVFSKPPSCGKTNIEAVVPCAVTKNYILIELWQGSRRVRRRKEYNAPYFLFGNNGADIYDGKIAAGKYGIRAVVDGRTSPFTNFTLGGKCG